MNRYKFMDYFKSNLCLILISDILCNLLQVIHKWSLTKVIFLKNLMS